MPNLFCFGLGYSARFFAKDLQKEGFRIFGTCQSDDKAAELTEDGFIPFLFDRTAPLSAAGKDALAQSDYILSSVPPDKQGDAVLDIHGGDIERAECIWVGYLSTTGVYGDTGGALVNEQSPRRPTSDRSRRRMEAEDSWLALKAPVHLFRLSGIYGPGYSMLDKAREGRIRRIVRKDHLFSRIHVEDISKVLRASMNKPNPGAAYNLCDDQPAPPADVNTFACDLLGIDPPPLEEYDLIKDTMSPMALSFWQDSRLVDNSRIKTELGVSLSYPGYEDGLRAILKAEMA